jgi:calcium/calmodulin-dependent protein kinase I
MAKARLRRGIEIVKLANRIEALKMQEDDNDEVPGESDVPADAKAAAGVALAGSSSNDPRPGLSTSSSAGSAAGGKRSLSNLAKGAIFREVVLAKVREMKESEKQLQVEKEAEAAAAKRKSWSGEGS